MTKSHASAAAEIRAAIADTDTGPLEAELAAMLAERREKLLTAADEDIIALDLQIAKQRLAIERATVRAEALAVELAEAEAAEAEAAFRARHADVVAGRDALMKSYSSTFAKAARAIADIVDAEKASADAVAALGQDELELYGLARPVLASNMAWGRYFLHDGVSLADASLPPTKTSPALGAFARSPQALSPELGA